MIGYRETANGATLELKTDASGYNDWITVEPRGALRRDASGTLRRGARSDDKWVIFGRVEGAVVDLSIPSRSRKRLARPTLHQMAFLYRDLVVQHYQSDRSAA